MSLRSRQGARGNAYAMHARCTRWGAWGAQVLRTLCATHADTPPRFWKGKVHATPRCANQPTAPQTTGLPHLRGVQPTPVPPLPAPNRAVARSSCTAAATGPAHQRKCVVARFTRSVVAGSVLNAQFDSPALGARNTAFSGRHYVAGQLVRLSGRTNAALRNSDLFRARILYQHTSANRGIA
jgi:hypothetical protein